MGDKKERKERRSNLEKVLDIIIGISFFAMSYAWVVFGVYLIPQLLVTAAHPELLKGVLCFGIASGAVLIVYLGFARWFGD